MGNSKKKEQLGMNPGTAAYRLRKMIMFKLIQTQDLDVCFQCGEKIKDIDNLSVEHKVPWLDSDDPVGLFFDLNNIAFSHLRCNIIAGQSPAETKELECSECGGVFDKELHRIRSNNKRNRETFCSRECASGHGGRKGGMRSTKLRPADAKEIRRLYKTGRFTQEQLGKMFLVSRPNVGKIVRLDTWKQVS